ncbi:MAG: (Fe-S)-binding protein [Deltaproteobacteria bacterium]|jgi:Fe-S oxidoreductase|nr:(Fe-S)-binding protein [Deltaproteobacteria bacterium]
MKASLEFKDMSRASGQMTTVEMDDLKVLPLDVAKMPWKPLGEDQKEKYCCLLDDLVVLQIPRPTTPAEEEEMVNKFLNGMRKLFNEQDNWTFLPMLETSMNYCAQCNSCADACHLFEMTSGHEMYRPNFRSEIFRRIYKHYVKKEPFAAWRFGDCDLNWQTVARLGELAYRCNLCRRCAQTCPIGVDNGLIAREIRKLFSQEFGINPPELHEKGSMLQMRAGSSTGMDPKVVRDNVAFIDEDFSEITGYQFETPWDVEGADILLLHNAGEIMAWPDNIAAFSIIFQAAGLSWTLSSELAAYDGINYGVFYDDVQFARTALLHAQAAKKLGVKKIVLGECGHAHKALTVIADRVLPPALNIPRESCFPLLRDIVMSGKIAFDPSRNNFPVTLNDSCNVVRLMGIVKPQREIMHRLCPQFREMHPHGVNNYCCGGGSGFAIMSRNNIEIWRNNISGRKKMEQIAGAFADCLSPDIQKYICAPCSNCKGQIREILEHNHLLEKNSLRYGGIVELIVNAMVDVNPGFIKWEEE